MCRDAADRYARGEAQSRESGAARYDADRERRKRKKMERRRIGDADREDEARRRELVHHVENNELEHQWTSWRLVQPCEAQAMAGGDDCLFAEIVL